MATPWIGEMMMFGGNFAPRDWAFCTGSLYAVAQNDVLFALIGTTYGGDGLNTFALPNLAGRLPLGTGTVPGLSSRAIGETGGVESVQVLATQMPSHTHSLAASSREPTSNRPGNAVPAVGGAYGAPDGTALQAGALANAGGSQPHDNMSPYLTLSFCISLFGVYPTQT